jgi:endonuclease/exonuclease/phosphatase family metal-dependent hydrolase
MRIATFNLESFGLARRTGASIETRLRVLRPELERLDADILCLQEINAEKPEGEPDRALLSLNRLLENTQYAGYFPAHSVHPEDNRLSEKHNLVTLSRWPICETQQVWHELVPAPSHHLLTSDPAMVEPGPQKWDRPVLHCVITPPGSAPLHVINLHLRAPLAAPIPGKKKGSFNWASASAWAEGFYIAALKRNGQALEVRLLIDRLFDDDPDARIVVCGDFNATEREVPTKIIAASVEDTGNGDLRRNPLPCFRRVAYRLEYPLQRPDFAL